MTKEERIQVLWIEAIGIENYVMAEKYINKQGWLNCRWHQFDFLLNATILERKGNGVLHELSRPKSLQGIEDNNGWIKLQGLANEIQKRCSIWIETKNGDIEYLKENEFLPIGYAVAYQVAEKPKKRIY